MVVKDLMSTNGYTMTDPVTPDEMTAVLKPILHEFKCLIVNKNTAKKYDLLNSSSGTNRFITINNKVPDGMFYVNAIR